MLKLTEGSSSSFSFCPSVCSSSDPMILQIALGNKQITLGNYFFAVHKNLDHVGPLSCNTWFHLLLPLFLFHTLSWALLTLHHVIHLKCGSPHVYHRQEYGEKWLFWNSAPRYKSSANFFSLPLAKTVILTSGVSRQCRNHCNEVLQ